MKKYILHIGLPKTATTTLQRYYFPKIQETSVCYNPTSIIDPIVQALKLLDFSELKKDDVKLLNNIIQFQSKKIPQKNILISLEILSQRLLKFDFVGRVQFLKSIFPSATIILVLRYQPTLLRSLYQQHVYQNYLLKPNDVFIPFSKHVFSETEDWKASMQINVKEWDYKEVIKYFRHYYGEQFHVLFFENFAKNIQGIGQMILRCMDIHMDNAVLYSSLPRTNVSYDSISMNLVLSIADLKLAFRSNSGFHCQHMHNLMEQANQARFLFDSFSVEEFIRRRSIQQSISRYTYSTFDKLLLGFIREYSKLFNRYNLFKYELPDSIRSYLERESKTLNSSLDEVVDRQLIPKQYL